ADLALPDLNVAEGIAVVPNDPNRYGPWAGRILLGYETYDEDRTEAPTHTVFSVGADGTVVPYHVPVPNPENILIIPENENFFGCQWTQPDGSQPGILWTADASEFKGMVGDILITDEYNGRVYRLNWNGTDFDARLIGNVTSWE